MGKVFLLSRDQYQKSLQKKIMISALVGGILEFYELTVFGFLTPVLSTVFYWPGSEPSKLFTYLVFAIGFLFRPLGAILFGHLGDRYSRKKALYASILLMGSATCLMGLLPGTASIGTTAPLLLICLRILQGLSAGGEFNGAILLTVEHTNPHRKGLISSFIGSSGMVGLLMGGMVAQLILTSSDPILYWRYAFLPGLLLALVSAYLRKISLNTPPHPQTEHRPVPKLPLLEAFKTAPLNMIASFFVAASAGLIIYTKSIFESGLESTTPLTSLLTPLFLMIFPPMFGLLSDVWKRVELMSIGMIGVMSLGLLSFFDLPLQPVLFFYCLFASMYIGPMHAWMMERFPLSSRYSAIGFSYSLGMGLVGGTAPLMAQFLYNQTGTPVLIHIYLVVMGLITLSLCQKVTKGAQKSPHARSS